MECSGRVKGVKQITCLKTREPEQTVDLKTESSNSGEVGLRENSEEQGNRACCSPRGRQVRHDSEPEQQQQIGFREIKPDGNVLSLINET